MKKKIRFLCILNLIAMSSHSQGLTDHWEMGYGSSWGLPFGGTDIDFGNGLPDTSYISRNMDFYVTNAVMSDQGGNLLFYTNGFYIANVNNDTMLNGSGINPGPFTNNNWNGMPLPQGNIILPVPGDSNKYYLFHETATYMAVLTKPLELFCSLIDMNLDSSLGGVSVKNHIVLQDTLEWGELCANRHANGRDWWLLFHKVFSDKFYKLLITPYGITTYTQNYGTMRNEFGGASAFSPDGTKFAHYNVNTDIDIYDFDRCTGILSNYINIPINDSAVVGSVAFSQNSNVLYVASVKYVYQFDLTATNIPATRQTVAVWDGYFSPAPPYATTFFMSQLGPDGKMYINCTNGVLDMHIINYPDSLGLACDVQQHSLHLPTYNGLTIPSFPNFSLGRDVGSPCDSLTGINTYNNTVIPLTINPNPASDVFNINYELPYGKLAVVTIYNALGKLMERRGIYWYFEYLQVGCKDWENGVYVVKIEGDGINGSAKVVVIK